MGAEIRSVVHSTLGELLFLLDNRESQSSLEQWPGDDPAEAWLSDYRGGWQVLFPNVGSASFVGSQYHPYHGSASRTTWELVSTDAGRCTLRCEPSDGLEVLRTVDLSARADSVRVTTLLSNHSNSSRHFLFSEHPAFPLSSDVRVWLASADDDDLDSLKGPIADASDREAMNLVDMGPARRRGAEGWSTVRMSRPRAEITWPERGVAVDLSWDLDVCPYASIWFQNGVERYPFGAGAGCITIEPSSVHGFQGLGKALTQGTASILTAGQTRTTECVLTVRDRTAGQDETRSGSAFARSILEPRRERTI